MKPPYTQYQRFTFKLYERVICNGYPGSVQEICTGQLDGMVVVRVPGGRTCVSSSWPDCYPDGGHLVFDELRAEILRRFPDRLVLEDGGKVHVFASSADYDAYRNGGKP